MKFSQYKFLSLVACLIVFGSCTKLHEDLGNSFVFDPASGGSNASSLLTHCYSDLGFLHNQDQLFSLEENTSDECLVPTRGGDWDDNGVWRVLHAHAWDATHGQSSTVFNSLGLLESDATTVLALNPTAQQSAEATFLRSFAQFYFEDLYGQVPYRTIQKYNSVDASPVMDPATLIDTLTTNLTGIIAALPSTNDQYQANQNAARFLLMKVLLNKQAFLNRQTPAAATAADMQEVYSLGTAIVNSGKNSLQTSYFDNFGPDNGGFGAPGTFVIGPSTEEIFAYDNNGTSTNANGTSNGGIDSRWFMTLHYNSYDATAPGAGWNGFSTISELYNAFDASDTRKGNVAYPIANANGVSPISGLRVGLDEGLQYNENGVEEKDRKGNPLNFTDSVHLVETNVASLEDAGIRIIKYYPDYAHYSSTASNQLVIFRYADVLLMMAEADLRGASGGATDALKIINSIHAARGAKLLTSVSLVNASNLYDPSTLLAERQKELYWESWRRQDLIRFGVFLVPWDLKTVDDPKYLLFPIPATQLIVNPNLKQNAGY